MIKPIETNYNGYRFRSRLEARWAVFLDQVGCDYMYEPEGFEFDDGVRYLPDFYLPDARLWLEIKPGPNLLHKSQAFDVRDPSVDHCLSLARKLADGLKQNVAVVFGTPGALHNGWYVEHNYEVALMVANLQDCAFHDRTLTLLPFDVTWGIVEFLRGKGFDAPDYDNSIDTATELIEMDRQYYLSKYGAAHPKWKYDVWSRGNVIDLESSDRNDHRLVLRAAAETKVGAPVVAALEYAKAARFEFGELP